MRFYAACVFTLMCAWGYLALERWHSQPLSRVTAIVFAASIAGLGAIFASFYVQQDGHLLGTLFGRFDAVTAGFEFAVLAMGLLCMLLKEPPWWCGCSSARHPDGGRHGVQRRYRATSIEAVWMLGHSAAGSGGANAGYARARSGCSPLGG